MNLGEHIQITVEGHTEIHTVKDTVAQCCLELQVSSQPSNPIYQEEIYLQKENKD